MASIPSGGDSSEPPESGGGGSAGAGAGKSGGDSSEPPESGGGGSAGAGAGKVVVFHAQGCHLCERALAQVEALRAELGFELETVDVTGDPELEARYREWLPVVEVDGERAFVYHVHEDALRRRVTNSPQT